MEDLVQFLRDRCAEEAAEALRVADEFGAVWTADEAMEAVRSDTGADVIAEPQTPRAFIAAHDPARTLAEVEAKRRIIDLYDAANSDAVRDAVGVDSQDGAISALTGTVRLLAAVYADHPDYRAK